MDSKVKFDGYRSQIARNAGSVRTFTRRGLDWTSKSQYRDLAKAAAELEVETAIIDGETIVLNDAGLSDFAQGDHTAPARPLFRRLRPPARQWP
ncbi:hypothetical protein LJR234_006764 [Mesorhizobium amorphae]|uniref:ATP-dependent DNA ligase n=1 Tax=Mesorhizobium amorphae TaxID=71433 RepID=UPI003ECFC0C8